VTTREAVKEVKMGLADIPKELSKVSKEHLDMEIARAGMIAELDAISLYEQMAAMTENQLLKKVLLDVACEEKTHMGEFQAMLLMYDQEQQKELEGGRKEVEEMKAS
jgi:rubrerythrin